MPHSASIAGIFIFLAVATPPAGNNIIIPSCSKNFFASLAVLTLFFNAFFPLEKSTGRINCCEASVNLSISWVMILKSVLISETNEESIIPSTIPKG